MRRRMLRARLLPLIALPLLIPFATAAAEPTTSEYPAAAAGVPTAAPEAAPAPVTAEPTPPVPAAATQPSTGEAPVPDAASAPAPAPLDPFAAALRDKIATLPKDGTDEERNDRAGLLLFYEARGYGAVWLLDAGLTPGAQAVIAEIKNAGDWGLDPADFALPQPAADPSPAARADTELALTLAVLKYARYARGGRIANPPAELDSNLDRRPQFIAPREALDGVAAADDGALYLRALHPQHPQFERLRQKYLAARAKRDTGTADRLLANMEEWRWMWRDLGDFYVLANVPEFMLHVVKNGEDIHSERIVVGEVAKQTTIFSRRLKHIVFRPKWRVPESIKVKELWPSLLRGGGMFRKYDLQLETKDGQPLDYRSIDWKTADIREYEVTQPPGPKSVLGFVKFSFPSPHTIYMHDTPDKYMFNAAQRTLTHGCLRVRNPLKFAELLLAEDKGWDRAKIDDLVKNGPLNNEVAIERKIPIHIVYFTAWVNDDGSVKFYRDVYGHEQRIKLALEKKWDKIVKGPDHLAPVELNRDEATRISRSKPRKKDSDFDLLGTVFGL